MKIHCQETGDGSLSPRNHLERYEADAKLLAEMCGGFEERKDETAVYSRLQKSTKGGQQTDGRAGIDGD